MTDTLRIYVADLAAYNAGKLRGVWIDATEEPDEIMAEVQAMLTGSPELFSDEWAIHCDEGFEGVCIEEYASFEQVHELAMMIGEHGKLGAELLQHLNNDVDDAKRLLEDGYLGCWDSITDYAQDLTEQTTEIPDHLQYYLDYERMARDMELNGDIFTVEVGREVHIFANH